MLGPPPLPRNLEASVRDLGSARPEIRVSAIEDLTRHAGSDDAVRERALPLLVERLADDHSRVRAAAAVALADLKASSAYPSLLLAVDDDDAYVRQMALNAVGELGDPRALPRLRRALADDRPEMRYQAIIAFVRLAELAEERTSEVDDALLAATDDADDAVVHIAIRLAEERLDASAGRPSRAPDAPEVGRPFRAPGDWSPRVDPRIVARARALVASGTAAVALVAAIFALKAGSDDTAAKALVMGVVRGDTVRGQKPEKEDERAAIELVGELGLKEAIPYLEKRAWGLARLVRDTCTFSARLALARLEHPRAKREILAELGSDKRDVLAGAVVAAGRARLYEARPLIERLTAAAVDRSLVDEALEALDRSDGD